jgi:hypothetical protein
MGSSSEVIPSLGAPLMAMLYLHERDLLVVITTQSLIATYKLSDKTPTNLVRTTPAHPAATDTAPTLAAAPPSPPHHHPHRRTTTTSSSTTTTSSSSSTAAAAAVARTDSFSAPRHRRVVAAPPPPPLAPSPAAAQRRVRRALGVCARQIKTKLSVGRDGMMASAWCGVGLLAYVCNDQVLRVQDLKDDDSNFILTLNDVRACDAHEASPPLASPRLASPPLASPCLLASLHALASA